MTYPFKADLHTHTYYSDGDLSPDELIQKAKEEHVSVLSITDHDTLSAYQSSTFEAAKRAGVELVTGVELSCLHGSHGVHVLIYGVDIDNPYLSAMINRVKKKRIERAHQIIKNLNQVGVMISYEDVAFHVKDVIGRVHIAKTLVEKGYVKDLQSAFKVYLAKGKKASASSIGVSLEDLFELKKHQNITCVLAHPHVYRSSKLLRGLLQMPFDGIECYYSSYSKEICEKWVEEATKNNLAITAGSDFHSSAHSKTNVGRAWLNESMFHKFKEYLKHHKAV